MIDRFLVLFKRSSTTMNFRMGFFPLLSGLVPREILFHEKKLAYISGNCLTKFGFGMTGENGLHIPRNSQIVVRILHVTHRTHE